VIGGSVFHDLDGDGIWGPSEEGLQGWTVYLDLDENGQWDDSEPYDPIGTGYMAPADVGLSVDLKLGDPHDTITSGFFFAVNFPPLNGSQGSPEAGGAQYRWNIANCSEWEIGIGDHLQIEPGNMVGPTKHGVRELIASDPSAYWDSAANEVLGSAYGTSPRVVKIALFDPYSTPKSGRNHVVISKLGAFFLEGVTGQSTVRGRFMDMATLGEECDPSDPGLLYSVQLEE
jgi:hypothetical protein